MKAIIPIASAAALLVAACENPADSTTDATVGEAQEKTVTPASGGTKYAFTENSKIGFVGSKVTGSHEGGFEKFSGHFTIEDGAPVGNDHKFEIDMTSTWSDNPKLTQKLKGPDFFDMGNHPTTTFDVTELTKTDAGYSVTGNLNLHGVEKSITFPATVSQEGDTARIKAEFDINRFDFEIEYPGKTNDLIRNEVVIKLDLEAKPE
jgi:polyisoprenoid-binding protein YceI